MGQQRKPQFALPTSSIVQISGISRQSLSGTHRRGRNRTLSQSGFYAVRPGHLCTWPYRSRARLRPQLFSTCTPAAFLPTTTGLTLGQIAQIEPHRARKSSSSTGCITRSPSSSSTPALWWQVKSVSIGGPASGATNASAVTTNRIVLRHWGFNGTVVCRNRINPGNGTVQIEINGFAGLLVPQTVTVYTASRTDFRYGFKWNEQRHRRCECARGRPADEGPNLGQHGAAGAFCGRTRLSRD